MNTWQKKLEIIETAMEKMNCSLSDNQRMVLVGCLCGMDISEPEEERADYDRGWEAYEEGLGISDAYADCLDGTKESMLEWQRGYNAALEEDTKQWNKISGSLRG